MAVSTVECYRKDDQVLGVSVVEFDKIGNFNGASATLGGPEVQQDRFSSELGQGCFLSF